MEKSNLEIGIKKEFKENQKKNLNNLGSNLNPENKYRFIDFLKPGIVERGLYVIEVPFSLGIAFIGNPELSLAPQALTYALGRSIETLIYFRNPKTHNKFYPRSKTFITKSNRLYENNYK